MIAVSQSTKPEFILSHLAKIKFLKVVTLFCQAAYVPPQVEICLGISGSITAIILSSKLTINVQDKGPFARSCQRLMYSS